MQTPQADTALLPKFIAIQDAYDIWFDQIVQLFIQEDAGMGDVSLQLPPVWADFVRLVQDHGIHTVQEFKDVQKAMGSLQASLLTLSGAAIAERIDQRQKVFQPILQKYMVLKSRLQSFERSVLASQTDHDTLTPLRPVQYLEREYAREMERFSRQGAAFCVCLAQVDVIPNFGSLENGASDLDEKQRFLLRHASEIILNCVRIFDDVFRMEDGTIFILLKQTEQPGALRFVRRLQKLIASSAKSLNTPFPVTEDDLTLSCCVAEVVVGEPLPELIIQMQGDLYNQLHNKNDIVARRELSPLQRYLAEEEQKTA